MSEKDPIINTVGNDSADAAKELGASGEDVGSTRSGQVSPSEGRDSSWLDTSNPVQIDVATVAEDHKSRRHFLRSTGRKAAYIAPVVFALSTSDAVAASGFDSTCGDVGSPCTADGDCCGVLTCVAMSCA